jgi:hypothetical protein
MKGIEHWKRGKAGRRKDSTNSQGMPNKTRLQMITSFIIYLLQGTSL